MAKWIAGGTIIVIAGLALLFARLQNPAADETAPGVADHEPPRTGPSQQEPPPATRGGRAVYDRLGCARCHSIGGEGNPRYPLDGVGTRRGRDDIRAWILGVEAPRDSLPPSALRRKGEYRDIAPDDLEALLDFMASLRDPG